MQLHGERNVAVLVDLGLQAESGHGLQNAVAQWCRRLLGLAPGGSGTEAGQVGQSGGISHAPTLPRG